MSGVTRWCTGGGGSMRCEGTTARRTDFPLRAWWLGWARTGARAVVAARAAVVVAERAGAGAVCAGSVAPAAGDVAGAFAAAAGDVAGAFAAGRFVAGRPCSVAEPHAARVTAPDVRTTARAAVVRKRSA
jgi:hypothetical protein